MKTMIFEASSSLESRKNIQIAHTRFSKFHPKVYIAGECVLYTRKKNVCEKSWISIHEFVNKFVHDFVIPFMISWILFMKSCIKMHEFMNVIHG